LIEYAIASAIEHHLNHPKEAKAMGDRARELILNRYTWKQIAARLIETYEAILNQNLPSIHQH